MEEPTPKQNARKEFIKEFNEKSAAIGMKPIQEEISEEHLDEMIKSRIEFIECDIKRDELPYNLHIATIARMEADIDLLTNVDLKEAKTEWHKKVVQAEIDELQAVIDQKRIALEQQGADVKKLKEDLEKKKELL
jgi:hypothetical protein